MVAGDRIALVLQSMKIASQHPGLLQKFELSLDVAVHAHEEESWFRAAVISAMVWAAYAQYPMTVRDANLRLRPWFKSIAGIGTADMRPEWATQAVRVFCTKQEVVVLLDGDAAGSARRSGVSYQ